MVFWNSAACFSTSCSGDCVDASRRTMPVSGHWASGHLVGPAGASGSARSRRGSRVAGRGSRVAGRWSQVAQSARRRRGSRARAAVGTHHNPTTHQQLSLIGLST
ncbi:hypothetical protein MSG28_005482 [Choristoneura fumiferana]|uniref:Uncharacterized protein n=1 Tax=Choristoneura fumiferana TaxID=7141 RepID=A0ACC0L0A2_CHOFU|nr:hypothetical protein MSG28_005482 [Choristoneura fumiferana]